MKPNHFIALLLVAANLSFDAAVFAKVEPFPALSARLFLGLVFGQLGCLAAWVTIGRGSLTFRIVSSLVACLLVAICMGKCSRPGFAEWFCVLSIYVGGTISYLFLLRLPGLFKSLCFSDKRAWQYTIGGILGLTTCVAFILGSVRWMEFPWAHPAEIVTYSVTFGAVAVSLINTLASEGSHLRFAIPLLTLVAATVTLPLLLANGPLLMMAFPIQAAVICLNWSLLRVSARPLEIPSPITEPS